MMKKSDVELDGFKNYLLVSPNNNNVPPHLPLHLSSTPYPSKAHSLFSLFSFFCYEIITFTFFRAFSSFVQRNCMDFDIKITFLS